MNDPNDPFGLHQEILLNTLPPGVVDELPFIAQGLVLPDFYPEDVAQALVQQMNPVVLLPPLPNFAQDVWMTYIDRSLEQRYLKWEANSNRWHFAFSSLFFFCCSMIHFFLCFKQINWNGHCGGHQITFILATLLIWIPVFTLLLPERLLWRFKELLSALHQILFGIMIPLFFKDLWLNGIEPNLVFYCTFPLLLESVLFKVRLRYHVPLNVVMTSLILSPWLNPSASNLSFSSHITSLELRINLLAMLIMPGCLVALYESLLRRRFQTTF